MISVPTFFIYVWGFDERENYILKEHTKHNIPFEFIVDGNKEDLSKDTLDKYFLDFMYE